MKKMGGLGGLMDKLPQNMMGNKQPGQADMDRAERDMKRMEGILRAMTAKERKQPALLMDGKSKASRKRRIATGAGVQIQDVNRLLNQFDQMQQHDEEDEGRRPDEDDEAHGRHEGHAGDVRVWPCGWALPLRFRSACLAGPMPGVRPGGRPTFWATRKWAKSRPRTARPSLARGVPCGAQNLRPRAKLPPRRRRRSGQTVARSQFLKRAGARGLKFLALLGGTQRGCE